jgi:hypothetical protein
VGHLLIELAEKISYEVATQLEGLVWFGLVLRPFFKHHSTHFIKRILKTNWLQFSVKSDSSLLKHKGREIEELLTLLCYLYNMITLSWKLYNVITIT